MLLWRRMCRRSSKRHIARPFLQSKSRPYPSVMQLYIVLFHNTDRLMDRRIRVPMTVEVKQYLGPPKIGYLYRVFHIITASVWTVEHIWYASLWYHCNPRTWSVPQQKWCHTANNVWGTMLIARSLSAVLTETYYTVASFTSNYVDRRGRRHKRRQRTIIMIQWAHYWAKEKEWLSWTSLLILKANGRVW